MSNIQTLIQSANAIQKSFAVGDRFSAGTVAAALQTANGKIYTGICLDLACGLGFCAEHSAMAEMIKNQETEIAFIVAVKDGEILSPCGRCRELMMQIDKNNKDAQIILSETKILSLKDLLPAHWLGRQI